MRKKHKVDKAVTMVVDKHGNYLLRIGDRTALISFGGNMPWAVPASYAVHLNEKFKEFREAADDKVVITYKGKKYTASNPVCFGNYGTSGCPEIGSEEKCSYNEPCREAKFDKLKKTN